MTPWFVKAMGPRAEVAATRATSTRRHRGAIDELRVLIIAESSITAVVCRVQR
jgi:hypothetical protein